MTLLVAPVPAATPESRKLNPPSRSGDSKRLFKLLPPAQTGISSVNPIDTRHPLKRLYTSALGGGGVAAGDFDNDGNCDLYFVSGARENSLYLNQGDGSFKDISRTAGVSGATSWGSGVAAVDIDSDNDLDLYVCNYGSYHGCPFCRQYYSPLIALRSLCSNFCGTPCPSCCYIFLYFFFYYTAYR